MRIRQRAILTVRQLFWDSVKRRPYSTYNDEYFMELALDLAQQSFQQDEVPIGAVVVDSEHRVIGSARNRQRTQHDALAHAEINALKMATHHAGLSRLDKCSLYVTVEPCIMCLGACFLHHIDRIVYGAPGPVFGACGSAVNIDQTRLNHKLDISSGIKHDECAQLMKDFFVSKRNKA